MPTPSPNHAGDPVLVALGAAIRKERKVRGMSQEVLAHDSGVERAYMSAIERGMQNLSVMALVRMAKALGLTLADLMAAAKI
ncbi:MAG: XRE family transcriptional regulator [Variovorax sp.]|nr:MAG: XRE family transcriptional regulator [Variovorax sp.]